MIQFDFFFKWVVQPPTRSSEITEFVCTIQLEATVSPWKIDIRWNHHFALSLWFSIPSNMLVWNISDPFKAAVAETKPATPKLATQTEPWRAQNCCCSYWVEYLAIICNIYIDSKIYKIPYIIMNIYPKKLTSSNVSTHFHHKQSNLQKNPVESLRFQHLPSVATWLCAAPLGKVGKMTNGSGKLGRRPRS